MAKGQTWLGRRTGIDPLAYMGDEPNRPPLLVVMERRPTTNDILYNLGTLWIMNTPAEEVWILLLKAGAAAQWEQLYPAGGGGANTFLGDNGLTANPVGGVINIKGQRRAPSPTVNNNITVNASVDAPNNLDVILNETVQISGDFTTTNGDILAPGALPNGNINANNDINAGNNITSGAHIDAGGHVYAGNGLISDFGPTQLKHLGPTPGVMQTDGTGIVSSSVGAQGTVMMSGASAPAVWGTIEPSDASITIDTATAGKIKIGATGVGGSSFSAYLSAALEQPVGSPYYLGKLALWATSWDTTGGFDPGDGAGAPLSFTAQVTGKYFFQATVRGLGTPGSGFFWELSTGSVYYGASTSYPGAAIVSGSFSVAMNAGDYLMIQYGGSDIEGLNSGSYRSHISGHLIG